MKSYLIAFAAAAMFIGGAAHAAKIELTHEIQGASIHEDGIDMVVYYTHAADQAFEVVATYVEDDDASNPYRMRMALRDGDSVTFALPGRMSVNYTFARNGKVVSVETTPTGRGTKVAKAAE